MLVSNGNRDRKWNEYYISPLRKQLNVLHEPLSFHGHVSDGFALALKRIAWIRQLLQSKSYLNTMLSTALCYLISSYQRGECLWKHLKDAEGANVEQLKTFLPEAMKRSGWICVCYLQKVLVLPCSLRGSALEQFSPLWIASYSIMGGRGRAASAHLGSTGSLKRKEEEKS